jgi:two-component system phosphate regulon response regulator PhoB
MTKQKKRVMVVDDEQGFTEMVRMSLEQMGNYSVCEVNDPRKAVSAARTFMPELILLDVMMPEMDGGDVASALGGDAELADVPLIYLTALVSKEEAPAAGMRNPRHRFLPKPTSMVELMETIDETLARAPHV